MHTSARGLACTACLSALPLLSMATAERASPALHRLDSPCGPQPAVDLDKVLRELLSDRRGRLHALSLLQLFPSKVAALDLPGLFAAILHASATKTGTDLFSLRPASEQVRPLPCSNTPLKMATCIYAPCLTCWQSV